MKKILMALMVFAAAASLKANTEGYVMLSVFHPGQIPIATTSLDGIRINLIYGECQNLNGFDFGISGRVRERMNGFQLAGCNLIGTDANGVQFAFANYVESDFAGFQLGLWNCIGGMGSGFQLGVWNEALKFSGFEMGIVNWSGAVNGFQLGIVNRDDAVEVFAGEDCVILKKYQPSCYFCDSMDDVVLYRDKKICKACIRKLAAAIAAE